MNVTVCSCPFCVHMGEIFMTDEWSGLVDMLANLIEKYALELDIKKLPDITEERCTEDEKIEKEKMKKI